MKSPSVRVIKPLSKPSPQRWTPRPYMRKGVKFLLEHPESILVWDPGLAKTATTMAAYLYLRKRGMVGAGFIIAPLRVATNVWPGEQQKWADFNNLKMVILHGDGKEDLLKPGADLYVINYEGLKWFFSHPGIVRKLKIDLLVCDELTRFKHQKSGRSKEIKKHLDKFTRRWGLTGSFAANGLMNVFGQALVIDHGKALGKFITHFRLSFFFQPQPYIYKLQPGGERKIYERLAPLALRMSKEDYLDLPELVVDNIRIDLPPKARKMYDQLEATLFIELDKGIVTAANTAVALNKLRQVSSGAVFWAELDADELPTGKRRWSLIHDEKLDALEVLVESLNESPCLIAYEYRHDLERIRARLGDVPWLGGGVSAAKSNEIIAAWNAGDLPILLGHPQSMGHGLNLQGVCGHVIVFTLPWDGELYDQLIGRVHRQGTTAARVVVHNMLGRDTVDDMVLGTLTSKRREQAALYKALVDYRKSRRL